MEYLKEEITTYGGKDKFDIILIPHRVAHEKQVDISKDIARHMPQYMFIVAQAYPITKVE